MIKDMNLNNEVMVCDLGRTPPVKVPSTGCDYTLLGALRTGTSEKVGLSLELNVVERSMRLLVNGDEVKFDPERDRITIKGDQRKEVFFCFNTGISTIEGVFFLDGASKELTDLLYELECA